MFILWMNVYGVEECASIILVAGVLETFETFKAYLSWLFGLKVIKNMQVLSLFEDSLDYVCREVIEE